MVWWRQWWRLFLALETEMSLYPAAAVAPRHLVLLSARRRRRACTSLQLQQVRLALPLVLGQQERLGEEVLGGTDVLGDGVGAAVTTTEARPLLGTESPAVVASVRTGACTRSHTHTHTHIASSSRIIANHCVKTSPRRNNETLVASVREYVQQRQQQQHPLNDPFPGYPGEPVPQR